jgi:excisionase family DNA binding protein
VKDFSTIQEVATAAGVSVGTVRRWITEEEIATYSQGNRRRLLLHRNDVESLITPRLVERRTSRDAHEVQS